FSNETAPRSVFLPAVLAVIALAALYATSFYNYLLFHSLAEIFSIVIAFTIFIIAWNSRDHLGHSYLYLLGIAYLFIGFLDLVHTLAYKGMRIFADYDFYANQLWIAARYLESITLLVAFSLAAKRVVVRPYVVEVLFTLITGLILLSIFVWKVFPVCFVEGVGQTPFKVWSEYVISAILLVAIGLCVRNRHVFDPVVFSSLIGSLVFTILSELAFTVYVSNYGLANMVGHYFKIFSFYLIYKAIVETGIRSPYQLLFNELRQKEAELARQAAIDELTNLFNRRAALLLLEKQRSATRRRKTPLTISYIDLDGFKAVNDTFGHGVGDLLLKDFAEVLLQTMRAGDHACRMGGDEFLLILPDCPQEEAFQLMSRIESRVATMNARADRAYQISFSYGLAEDTAGGKLDHLLERADSRMYAQKAWKKERAVAQPGTRSSAPILAN
ncbi:MAG TPA: GGDEF domain-containing protein, partial [Desulfurivibrionaceae bacterium]|nr:GGDEF domain-containing protein [Desulfurivibrionaceae bacterium]